MTVSCKNSNSKKSEKQGETKDIVAVAKVILADDVLATIDQFAETYITSAEPGSSAISTVKIASGSDSPYASSGIR